MKYHFYVKLLWSSCVRSGAIILEQVTIIVFFCVVFVREQFFLNISNDRLLLSLFGRNSFRTSNNYCGLLCCVRYSGLCLFRRKRSYNRKNWKIKIGVIFF